MVSPAIHREPRKLPRLPALRSPRSGACELQFSEGLPGADIKNTGDESCLRAKRAGPPRVASLSGRSAQREGGAV